VPSSAEVSRSVELSRAIRAEIEQAPQGRITFARFMELALYEPRLGYYRQAADRPTDAGDFLTAPETHPIFGWTVARRIESMWAELGRPVPFALIEYGAGSGTLALSILEGFRRHGSAELLAAVRYTPIESNPHRLADLRRRFADAGLEHHLSLANEFLDALPVHRAVHRDGRLRELFVAWRDGFTEVEAEPSTPKLARRMAEVGAGSSLAEGQVVEICLALEPWAREAAARLENGFVLAIDYGYEAAELYGPRRLAGTLLGYRGHRVVESPLADPGLVDLTAHVDFTAVGQTLGRLGFEAQTLGSQQDFLVAAGLEAELQALQASADLTLAEYTRARSGIVRMLDPRHMGRFRVLVARRTGGVGGQPGR
jgi:SAM-dependent MidA family methyltransferase